MMSIGKSWRRGVPDNFWKRSPVVASILGKPLPQHKSTSSHENVTSFIRFRNNPSLERKLRRIRTTTPRRIAKELFNSFTNQATSHPMTCPVTRKRMLEKKSEPPSENAKAARRVFIIARQIYCREFLGDDRRLFAFAPGECQCA
jgi:hypothetical protein